jgi:hypothetical protein
MLRILNDLRNYRIHASDGLLGTVHDLFFDDRDWVLRYFVVNTGRWFPGRRVLISPASVEDLDWGALEIRVGLSQEQVKNSPDIATDKPVSRQEEERLVEHYTWPIYWAAPHAEALAGVSVPEVERAMREAKKKRAATGNESGDPDLRSMREVIGYHIKVRDGSIGHVEDFVGDDENWAVRYMVIDTRNWLPGKKVLVSPAWIESINWNESAVHVDLERDQIKDSPAFDPSVPINREYEMRLYDFYGRPRYW